MLETERQWYFSKSQLGIGYGANGCQPLCQDFLNDNYPLVLNGCVQLLLHFELISPQCNVLVEKFNFWSHWCIWHVENKGSNAFKMILYSVRHCTLLLVIGTDKPFQTLKHSQDKSTEKANMKVQHCCSSSKRSVRRRVNYCKQSNLAHVTLLTPSHIPNKLNCYLSFVTVDCIQYRFIITLKSREDTKHFCSELSFSP